MKIAICDDSREDIELLSSGITTYTTSVPLDIESYTSPKLLLSEISAGRAFDLVFLDVSMSEINGIQLGKKIRKFMPKCFIVFFTNYPQYALDAYECEAYHYLIKPVSTEKLHIILDRITRNFSDRREEYVIRGRFENVRVRVKDILYVEYYKKHVCFYIDSVPKKRYEVVGSIGEVYEKLKKFGFFRCHQSYIVNLEKISSFDGFSAILVTGDSIPISIRNKTDLIIAYTKYCEDM